MAGLNRVTLIGNLGKDPEVRYTNGGQAVANFTVATSESWTGKDGTKQEKTEWHRIVCWEKTAELVGKYLTKGRQVAIEGKLQTREWQDKEGRKQYTTEIVASNVVFLSDGKREGGAKTNDGGYPATEMDRSGRGGPGPSEEDIPF